MSEFCENCGNLTVFDNNGHFVCTLCKLSYNITPVGTLMRDIKTLSPHEKFGFLVYGTPKDPAAAISKVKCEKCKKFKKVMHLGADERTIFVCECIYAK